MAAPLKVTGSVGLLSKCAGLLARRRAEITYSALRWLAVRQKYPWSPDRLPTGDTFKAMRLTKKQNKVLKSRRKDDWWKTPLIEVGQKGFPNSDGEAEPSKLHMVIRVKETLGRPHWEKKTLEKLGLAGKKYKPVILKNIESVNEQLQTVKHLVEIRPVTFPYGLPECEDDLDHCYLRDNGEFVVQRRINPAPGEISEPPIQLIEGAKEERKWDMDNVTSQKYLTKQKEAYMFMSEYFKTQYVYKYNQDGKEFRYNQTDNIGDHKTWY